MDAKLFGDDQALPRIINSKAAKDIIEGANLDPTNALKEFEVVYTNATKSGLPYYLWNQKCIESNSCFDSQ